MRKEKNKYYENIEMRNISDNKKFWKTIKPFFSDKSITSEKITSIEKGEIISKDSRIAEIMNNFSLTFWITLVYKGINLIMIMKRMMTIM